jgi:hypothetical protein
MRKIGSDINVPTYKWKEALKFLNEKLKGRKLSTKLYLIGGGALILGYHLNRQTGDLDCILKKGNRKILNFLVDQLSEDLNLPEDWLNFDFEIYNDSLKLKNEWFQPFLTMDFLEIRIPNLKLCLALKCSDARMTGFREKDFKDIAFYIQKLQIKNLDIFYDTIESFNLLDTLSDSESFKLEKFCNSCFK